MLVSDNKTHYLMFEPNICKKVNLSNILYSSFLSYVRVSDLIQIIDLILIVYVSLDPKKFREGTKEGCVTI